MHCGAVDKSGEQDAWDLEPNSGAAVDALAALHPGGTLGLYALADDEVAAVNKLRAQKAAKTLKNMSRCQCDRYEYCVHCLPMEFRVGGLWHGFGA